MSSRKTQFRSFRAWPENQERLEFAEKVGLNVSELINEILREISHRPAMAVKTKGQDSGRSNKVAHIES